MSFSGKGESEVKRVDFERRVNAVERALIGQHPAIMKLRALIEKVAPSDVTILISGESGVGKEVVARAIHSMSPRHARPFVPVNCAAIPRDLLESEMFGHERGAFTGASGTRQGLFTAAAGGTILLDEIGAMPLEFAGEAVARVGRRRGAPGRLGSLD